MAWNTEGMQAALDGILAERILPNTVAGVERPAGARSGVGGCPPVAVVHVRPSSIVVFGASQNDAQSTVPVLAGAAGADAFSTATDAALAPVPNTGPVTLLAWFGLWRSTAT